MPAGRGGVQEGYLKNPFSLLPKLVEAVRRRPTRCSSISTPSPPRRRPRCSPWRTGNVRGGRDAHQALTSESGCFRRHRRDHRCGTNGKPASVAGLDPEIEIRKLTSLVHEYSKEAWANLELHGAIMRSATTGRPSQ